MAMPALRLLVVQPLPGIGDMIWHLPHIRALTRHAGGPVTLVAKPRSRADEIFSGEDTVCEVIWLDRRPDGTRGFHDGLAGLWRLIGTLRAGRFDAAVLLHNSMSLALAACAAGIPVRQGYGIGAQRWLLNRGPYLAKAEWRQHRPLQRATQFLRSAGIAMDPAEQRLEIAPAARLAVRRRRLNGVQRPLVALGIGSSEPAKQWGAQHFAALSHALFEAGWPILAVVGGPKEAELCRQIRATLGDAASRVVPALGWHMLEVAALLAESSFYVGNDTGMMNLAAAVGTRTYALFGMTPPLHHSDQIVPVLSSPGGPADGAARILLDDVLAVIRRDRGSLGPEEAPSTSCLMEPIGSQSH